MPINGFGFMNRLITFTEVAKRKYFLRRKLSVPQKYAPQILTSITYTPNLLPLAGFWVPQRDVIVDMKEKGKGLRKTFLVKGFFLKGKKW